MDMTSSGFPLDLFQKLEERRDYLIRRLLLYPMPRILDKHDILALHLKEVSHLIHGTRRLVHSPIAGPSNERCRDAHSPP